MRVLLVHKLYELTGRAEVSFRIWSEAVYGENLTLRPPA